MKIGVIYCGYNTEEYVTDSITPWIEAKKYHDIKISAVSVPFLEYKGLDQKEDSTTSTLLNLYKDGDIDILFTEPKHVREYVARNLCWYSLKQFNVDLMIFVDSDEIYTLDSINKVINYVKSTPEYDCYEINFKNYILDGKTWIDFVPFRIYRNDRHLGINQLYYDGDVIFNDGLIAKQTSHVTIPKEVAHIKHMTWLNNEKSKLKVQYQLKHFGSCSYRWNEQTNELELDLEYYGKHGYVTPTLHKD